MEIRQLRALVAVVDAGGFLAAAKALDLSQSTISFHIKSLEKAAGARLLDRGARRFRLTPAGTILNRYARRLLGLHEEALARLRADEDGERGQVSIAASTVPAEYVLPPILARFRRAHPAVAITVSVSDSRRAAVALLAQECDFALVGARLRDRRIVWSGCGDDEIVLVARPELLPPGPSLGARLDLARLPWIVREKSSGTAHAVAHVHLGGHARRPAPSTAIEVGSTEAARRCALEGVGVTFISRRAVAEDLAAGRLRLVHFAGAPLRRRLYVATLRGVTLPAAARALLLSVQGNR